MQTSGNFVGTFVELTSGMEYCHYYFESRLVQFFMLVYRDTTSVVFYCDRVVFVDSYLYVCTVTCHGLVDRVVYSLIYQVMQTFLGDVTDVHRRTFANSLKSFENLDVAR